MELYFLKDGIEYTGLQAQPDLDTYTANTQLVNINADSFNEVKKQIIEKYPNVAYIHLIDTNELNY